MNGYETGISPLVTIDMVRRARLTLTTAPLVSTGTGDPNAVGVYLLKNVTTPTTADYHFQGNAVANKVVVTNANFSGAAPSPVAFPASSPAEFRSAFSDPTGPIITLKGDGSGRIGQASWDTAGNWVGIGGGGSGSTPLDTYTAQSTGAVSFTTTGVAVPGCQVGITVGATTDRYLVNGIADLQQTTNGTAIAIVDLLIDGTPVGPQIIASDSSAGSATRFTVGQNWLLTGMSAGAHTITFWGS